MPNKLTYEEVRDYMSNEGFTLISETYKNAITKLDIKCPKGHLFQMRWNDFKTGFRCKHCSGKAKYTIEQVKGIVEARGYTLLDTDYKNSHSYVNMLCPEGHPCKIKFHAFNNRGDGCGLCGNKLRAQSNTFEYSKVKGLIELAGYTLISDTYEHSDSKIDIKCDKGHVFSMTLKMFNQGQRCSVCRSSKGEALVNKLLVTKIGKDKFIRQERVVIRGRRLSFDFFIPLNGKRLYVEYDGEVHYFPIDFFGGLPGLEKVRERDRLKNNYTEEQPDTYLLRLPYYFTDEEVEEFLYNFIDKHSSAVN